MRLRLLVVVAGLIAGVRAANAQMLGVPVLQNAFVNPGVTVGANVATGAGASVYGAAVAWAPASGSVQFGGGIALFHPDNGANHATWGLRAMAPIPKLGGRQFGVALFAGLGAMRAGSATETRIPVGASIGYRRALGARRGISVYLSPFLSWSRLKQDSLNTHNARFRASVGVDVAVLPGLGLTVGYEGGSRARAGEPGPAGGLFGVGLSYALRHPR